MAFELQDTKVSPVENKMSLMEKLGILSDAAKYDVSCSSSGVGRRGDGTGIGNTLKAGICHSFGADGRCISLLKILFTNECIYDCKYCINRRSNDVPRASFTPDEICELTIQFYRRNYIEGLFLSSGILQSPAMRSRASANRGRFWRMHSHRESPAISPPVISPTGMVTRPSMIPFAKRPLSWLRIIPMPTGVVNTSVHPKMEAATTPP